MEGSVGVGFLVLVVGVGSKCVLIAAFVAHPVNPRLCSLFCPCGLLLAWALVWVVGVGCWRGISRLRRGDQHSCAVLHSNQCSFVQEVDLRKE